MPAFRGRDDHGALVLEPERGQRLGFRLRFCFHDTATTEIYTLSLHDALPISVMPRSSAVRIVLMASPSSLPPHIHPPIDHVPSAMRELTSPVPSMSFCSIGVRYLPSTSWDDGRGASVTGNAGP